MNKKLLSLALCIVMLLSLVPLSAFSTEGELASSACTCNAECTLDAMSSDCAVCSVEGATPENCAKHTHPAAPTQEPAPTSESTPEPTPTPAETPASTTPAADDSAASLAAVQALVDALPTADAATPADYDAFCAVCDALDVLSPEQAASVTGTDKLKALGEYFASQVSATADSVAKIGTTEYVTLAEAFAAAKSGDTIILIYNCELTDDVTVSTSVMLNLNGYTISSPRSKTLTFDMESGGSPCAVTLTGGGSITAKVVVKAATFNVDPSCTATLNELVAWNSTSIVNVPANVNAAFNVRSLHVYFFGITSEGLNSSIAQVSLAGGSYGSVVADKTNYRDSNTPYIYQYILASGYAFADANGDEIPWSSMNNNTLVKVVPHSVHCDNINVNITDSSYTVTNGNDGKCDICGKPFTVRLTTAGGSEVIYQSITDALKEVNSNPDCTLTLLSNAELTANVTISKPFTLKTNGHYISHNGGANPWSITLSAEMTVIGDETSKANQEISPNIILDEGGTLTPKTSISTFYRVIYSGGTLNDTGVGCTYIELEYPNGLVIDMLPTGYAFFEKNASQPANAGKKEIGSNLHVATHQCSYSGGECTCGRVCKHESYDENNVCTNCGETVIAIATITTDSGTTTANIINLEDVLLRPNSSATDKLDITLISNYTYNTGDTTAKTLDVRRGTYTIDLNGNTLTIGSEESLWINYIDANVTIKNGTIDKVQLTGSTAGTATMIGQLKVTTLRVDEYGTLKVAGDNVTVTTLDCNSGGKPTLSGGTYDEIIADSKGDFNNMLAEGYLFYDKDNINIIVDSTKSAADILKGQRYSLKNVTVKKCTHENMTGNECIDCNQTFVATVTTAGEASSTEYFAALADAVTAAANSTGSTLTLLDNIGSTESPSDISTTTGIFTIDLNAKTLTGSITNSVASLKLKNGTVIGSIDNGAASVGELLADDYGFNCGTTWYDSTATATRIPSEAGAAITVAKLPIQSVATSISPENLTYSDSLSVELKIIDVTDADNTSAVGSASYAWYTVDANGTETPVEGQTNATLTLNSLTAGTYKYRCKITVDNYTKPVDFDFTVNKATLTAPADPTANKLNGNDLVFKPKEGENNLYTTTGESQQLVSAPTENLPDGCNYEYKLGENGTWTGDITTVTAADAGTYSVFWRVTGGTNYQNYTPTAPVEVKIAPAMISNITVSRLTKTEKTYDGTADLPSGNTPTYSTEMKNSHGSSAGSTDPHLLVNLKPGVDFDCKLEYAIYVGNNSMLTPDANVGKNKYIRATFTLKNGNFVFGESETTRSRPIEEKGEITPAPLKVSAKEKQVKIGDAVPKLDNPALGTDYTLEGLVNNETAQTIGLTDKLALDYYDAEGKNKVTPDTSKPGTYLIVPSLKQSAPVVAALYALVNPTGDNSPDPLANYQLTMISAKFIVTENPKFTITATAGANGSISPLGVTTVEQGGAQTYTITPNPGYVIAAVKVDGVNLGSIAKYTFSDVTANHTIEATFMLPWGNPQTGVDVD